MHKSLILLLALLLVSVKAPRRTFKSLFTRSKPSKSVQIPTDDMPQETEQPLVTQLPKVKLSDFVSFRFPRVPSLIIKCIVQIHTKCKKSTGEIKPCDLRSVFRATTQNEGIIKNLFRSYVNDDVIPEVDHETCGGLIKMFLRQMEINIMHDQLENCIKEEMVVDGGLEFRAKLIEALPTENRETLAIVMMDAWKIIEVMAYNAEILSPLSVNSPDRSHSVQCKKNVETMLGMAMFDVLAQNGFVKKLGPTFKDGFSRYSTYDLDTGFGLLKAVGMLPPYIMSLFLDMGQSYWAEVLAKSFEKTELPYPPQPSGAERGWVLVES